VQITELHEKVAGLEKTKAQLNQQLAKVQPEMEQVRRKARRATRSLASALATAMAFIAGHLVRAYVPGLRDPIDEATAQLREGIAEATGAWAGGAAGGALLLYIILVLGAGARRKSIFLVPAILLAVAALAAGLLFRR
jgi:uncharacterized coiled-coil protein SlyX